LAITTPRDLSASDLRPKAKYIIGLAQAVLMEPESRACAALIRLPPIPSCFPSRASVRGRPSIWGCARSATSIRCLPRMSDFKRRSCSSMD
jgi:hypothetical protein